MWVGEYVEVIEDYWPGVPADSMKCACGLNRTCADPRLGCNCNIGDKKERLSCWFEFIDT